MTTLVGDIETDGLDPTLIWVFVTKCIETGEVKSWYNKVGFQDYMDTHDSIVFHNGIGFDVPVLEKLWKINFSNIDVVDTLVMSRLADPQRDGHALKWWGELLNFPKGDHDDWSQYSEDMLVYCKQDVDITEQVYIRLLRDLDSFGAESVKLEHQVQTIIQQQVRNGWLLDQPKARDLVAELKERSYDLEEEVQRVFKPLPTYIKEIQPKIKKDGSMSIVGLKFLGDQWTNVAGPFHRIDWPLFNLGSRQQIGRYLQYFGWVPKEFTETEHPIVSETILTAIKGIPEAELIASYLLVQKRVAQVRSWLESVNEDNGRVHGYVNTNGAVTGRMTHSKPNLAQVPSSSSLYGPECRGCWIVPKRYKLVGIDASGLELRMLAHYMQDDDYTNTILTGDIHTANQLAAGLITRDQAKTFILTH